MPVRPGLTTAPSRFATVAMMNSTPVSRAARRSLISFSFDHADAVSRPSCTPACGAAGHHGIDGVRDSVVSEPATDRRPPEYRACHHGQTHPSPGQPAGRGDQLRRPPPRARRAPEEARHGPPGHPRRPGRRRQDPPRDPERDRSRSSLPGRRMAGRAGRRPGPRPGRQRGPRGPGPARPGSDRAAGPPALPPAGPEAAAPRGQLRAPARRGRAARGRHPRGRAGRAGGRHEPGAAVDHRASTSSRSRRWSCPARRATRPSTSSASTSRSSSSPSGPRRHRAGSS